LAFLEIARQNPPETYLRSFESSHLPTLSRLAISYSVWSQLRSFFSHIEYLTLNVPLFRDSNDPPLHPTLHLPTSLKRLNITCGENTMDELMEQLEHVQLESLEIHFTMSGIDWFGQLRWMDKMRKILEESSCIKTIEWDWEYVMDREPSSEISGRTLAKWNRWKRELRTLCLRKEIEIVKLSAAMMNDATSDDYRLRGTYLEVWKDSGDMPYK
jgi:hypothetical protein